LRTLETLKEADVICAEDTRVTGKLLAAYEIKKPLERLDENTLAKGTHDIMERVLSGEVIAYCSDAGMPGVSDPGARLVKDARLAGIPVEVLPGANAVTLAFVAAGFMVPQFYFGGFFPRKDGEREDVLSNLMSLDAALVFYESPKRLSSSLELIARELPYRRVAVCRELTKMHEEVFVDTSGKVAEEFKRRESEEGIRGEIVLVIDVASVEEKEARASVASKEATWYAQRLAQEGGHSKKDIAKCLQERFGISRNEAYEIALSSHHQ